jgi:hypothetical protein
MRRPLALLALSVPWIGCFSDSAGAGPQAQFDAGFDGAEFDTSVQDGPVEAPSTDSSLEAAPPEAAPPMDAVAPVDAAADSFDAGVPVVVLIQGGAGPEAGVTIVYADASGNPLATQTTDATGRASRVVASGSMLTALLGNPTVYSAPVTIMGVEPGDVLTLIDWSSLPAPTVDVGAQSAFPQTTNFYHASAALCGSQPGQLPVSLAPSGQGCFEIGLQGLVTPLAFPLILEAFDENDDPLGFLSAKSSGFPGAPDAGDSGAGTVTLGGSWSTSYTTQNVTITDTSDAGIPYGPTVTEAVGGTLTLNPQYHGGNPTSFWTHVGYPDFVQVEANNSTYYEGAIAIAQAVAPPAASGTLTIDATALSSMPQLGGVNVDDSVAAQPTVLWSTITGSASLSTVTGIVTFASWTGGTGGADAGASAGTWMIVSPPTAQTSLQAPVLPPALIAWAPASGASYPNANVWGYKGTALPTYGAVRAAASALWEMPACAIYPPIIPALPAVGTSLMVTMLSNAQCG